MSGVENTVGPGAPRRAERGLRELGTGRLDLQAVRPADGDELHRLFLDPQVRRYLLDDEEMPREFVDQVIDDSDRAFSDHGVGLFVMREKGRERIVGFVGFREFFEPPELQLLYGLHPDVWGRGYATESSRAIIDHAFSQLAFEEVIAATDPPNNASLAVMRRLGLRDRPSVEKDGRTTLYTGIRRDQWRSDHGEGEADRGSGREPG
ncbi:MAG: N-acetyltransferase [Acidobacteria bacterium]|nr:MAG: N-acetyltransferase [Acidobacteriota bacterium]REK07275.1 MAG: N-acetyltransferase [Acidobacteriota bacterium]